MSARICPYVGLAEDPETSLAFPSELNCCHWANPIEPINLDHQRSYCLSARFSRCSMLETKDHRALLPAIKLEGERRGLSGRWILGSVILLGLLLIVYFIYTFWGSFFSGDNPDTGTLGSGGSIEISSPTVVASPSPLGVIPMAASPSPGLTSPIPSATSTPSQLPEESPIPDLVTPTPLGGTPAPTTQACGPFDGWVLYTVRPNDTLFGLSLIFEVSITDLQLANCLGDSTNIQAGQRLYVPFPLPLNPTPVPTSIPTQTLAPPAPTAASTDPSPPTNQPPSPSPRPPTETSIAPWPTATNIGTPTPVPPLPTPVPSNTPGQLN